MNRVIEVSVLTMLTAVFCVGQTLTTVHSFSGPDGQLPGWGVLTQGRDEWMYGTTFQGGQFGLGTVFKQRTVDDRNILLYSFSGPDGSWPVGGLTLARDGNFYGATITGGVYDDGTIFRINSAGTNDVRKLFSHQQYVG